MARPSRPPIDDAPVFYVVLGTFSAPALVLVAVIRTTPIPDTPDLFALPEDLYTMIRAPVAMAPKVRRPRETLPSTRATSVRPTDSGAGDRRAPARQASPGDAAIPRLLRTRGEAVDDLFPPADTSGEALQVARSRPEGAEFASIGALHVRAVGGDDTVLAPRGRAGGATAESGAGPARRILARPHASAKVGS